MAIDEICGTITQLLENNDLVLKITSDVMAAGLKGPSYEPEYTAEKPEYIDIMPVMGMATRRTLDEFQRDGVLSNVPLEAVIKLANRIPEHLSNIADILQESKIEREISFSPTK